MDALDFTDAELVAQTLAGSRDAFGRIVSRYQSLICSLNYSATGDLGQSEDLAQETFITAWKDLGKLREPDKLRPWLCRISRNLTFDVLRKQGREPSHDAEPLDSVHESPAPGLQPAERAITTEEQEILWRSVGRIPEIYREPLILFYREHQSVQAVAQKLELSEDAVKQRLSRGRKLLQEQVLAFVEGALERTNPGKVFTIGVLAALSSVTISAKAATAGAVAVKGSAAAKAAAATGLLGALAGPLMAFFGNYVGYRMSLATAESDGERARIKSAYRTIFSLVVAFSAALAGLGLWAGFSRQDRSPFFGFLFTVLAVSYAVTMFILIVRSNRRHRKFIAGLVEKGMLDATTKPAWEFRSRASLFGLPLVHICFGDRRAVVKKPVTAWIAVGDRALGGLFAFGGIAIAPVSIGGCAIGLFSFGGLALGILVLGGFGFGVWTFCGMGAGWQAFGGGVFAWKAAMGGFAIAHDFALGGIAQAAQANNKAAAQFISSSWFFRNGLVLANYGFWLNLIWIIPMLVQWRVIVKKRRREQERAA